MQPVISYKRILEKHNVVQHIAHIILRSKELKKASTTKTKIAKLLIFLLYAHISFHKMFNEQQVSSDAEKFGVLSTDDHMADKLGLSDRTLVHSGLLAHR